MLCLLRLRIFEETTNTQITERMNVLRSVRDRGLVETVKRFVKYDTLKAGRLVGTDKYGNNYYENKELMYGQHRWVEYADDDYDASHGTRVLFFV